MDNEPGPGSECSGGRAGGELTRIVCAALCTYPECLGQPAGPGAGLVGWAGGCQAGGGHLRTVFAECHRGLPSPGLEDLGSAVMAVSSGAGGPAAEDQDWTADVAGRIESAVALVRDKTTVPATLVARGIVFGVVVGVLGAAMLLLLVMSVVRVADVYLPFHPHGRRVWVSYAVASAIFFGVGAFAWRKRRPKAA